jgi:hypothetical protein
MTLEEFRRLADTWGGDIDRWPPRTKSAAGQHAATQEGAEILAQARQLDGWLAAAPVVAPDRAARAAFAVVQRIAAEGAVPMRPGGWWRRTWLMPVAGLAFSALMGVSLATLTPYGGSARSTSALSAILDTGSLPALWVIR